MRPTQLVARRVRTAAATTEHPPRAHRLRRAACAAGACALISCPPAAGAAPPPCGGNARVADARGDGHHASSDVLGAWLSEAHGRLQAVIQTDLGDWTPAHEDSETAGFAMLFGVGGATRYVRVVTLQNGAGPPRYDHGTWSEATGFVSAGATSGEVLAGRPGSATIDVPAATGAVAGTRLAQPFVMTYDGGSALAPHWVDRAPGGAGDETPTDAAFGADYVVGSCGPHPPGGGAGSAAPPGATVTTAVVLTAARRLTGGGRLRVTGRVLPARAGVLVRLTVKPRRTRGAAVVRTLGTRADGTYAYDFTVAESSFVDAVAEGINAQTHTVTVRSTVSIALRRARDGKTAVSGRVAPRIPGRALLLRANAFAPTATTSVTKGRYRFKARRLRRGRYQVVFVPAGGRAERSTSKSGVVR